MNETSQRRETRHPYEAAVECVDFSSQQVIDATIRNYSRGGVYFECDRAFEIGRQLCINIKKQQPDSPHIDNWHSYRVEVMRCRPLTGKDQDGFGIGIRYIANYDHFLHTPLR